MTFYISIVASFLSSAACAALRLLAVFALGGRLAPPIAFNFMIIAMPPAQDTLVDVRQTTFYAELGERMLDLSSLGNFLGMASLSFTTFAPFIMLPWLLVVLFRQQTKFCKLGRNKLAFSEDSTEEEEEASGAAGQLNTHNPYSLSLSLSLSFRSETLVDQREFRRSGQMMGN